MCGGIMGALTFSLPPGVRSEMGLMLPFVLAYNLGRLLSYGAAGALFGLFGAGLFEVLEPWLGQGWPQRLAALVMIAIGLNIAGLLPQLTGLERFGAWIWRGLEPLGRALLPVRTLPKALLYGVVWGWLPCGLVYGMLIAAAGQGAALPGALMMLAFGLGTLPSVMLTGILAGRLQHLARRPGFRLLAGAGVALFGLVALLYPSLVDWGTVAPVM
ncbi:MAG: sulfite exporter TauE/SafE family protein [Gammaproteobacteria bacterium]|nr:sulfite exporter TauE/SafE family protein [Gammaproteobacteria bacterium]MBU1655853.1 sulfite exporter TauE/SafE family protein [Gammaproteobacteria bacterium]MBU1960088.1 sulfite exporter TauE/SafE family protein [Gammaproteobacteria bacterium]